MGVNWDHIIYGFLPLWMLALTVLVLMGSSLFLTGKKEVLFCRSFTIGSLLATAFILFRQWQSYGMSVFADILIVSRFNLFLAILIVLASLLTVLVSAHFVSNFENLKKPEFYTLIVLATLGMLMMNMSLNLLFIFLGLELASLCFYILIALRQENRWANEAAIKYFLMGSVASALFLYGIAFFYGATQELNLQALRGIAVTAGELLYLKIAFLLLFIGAAFKLALFPFHLWVPDVYQGSPTLLTGWMASTVKAAVFGVFLTLLSLFNNLSDPAWLENKTIIALLSATAGLTMLVGNLLAIRQHFVKRLLACSSIAHAGYLLIALATAMHRGPQVAFAVSALLFYLLVYTIMTLGAFFCVSLLSRAENDDLQLAELAGLGRTHPQIAFYLSIFMLSLAGIPPTAGFIAKYTLFIYASERGLYGLLVVGIVASLVGLYYYLKVIALMYFSEPGPDSLPALSTIEAKPAYYFSTFLIVCLAILSVALGVFPEDYLLWSWFSK